MEQVVTLRAKDYFGADLPICINKYVYDRYDEIRLHRHEFIEIAYVCRGTGKHVVDGREQPVSKGDLFILQSDTPHSFFPDDPANSGQLEVYNCMFMPEMIGSLHLELPVLREVSGIFLLNGLYPEERTYKPDLKLTDSHQNDFQSVFAVMHEEFARKREGYFELLKLKLCELLIQIYRAFKSRYKESPHPDRYRLELIQRAILYLREHYASPVQLGDISRHALLSKSYFSALFKKTTGMSVFEYLQKLRIEEACRMLVDGSDKITDIAGKVGYGDYRFFNKTFRKMTGMTAQQYRKKANPLPISPITTETKAERE